MGEELKDLVGVKADTGEEAWDLIRGEGEKDEVSGNLEVCLLSALTRATLNSTNTQP